jgi:ABC-type branched-subunit amino acid transport system substrate-binding protein
MFSASEEAKAKSITVGLSLDYTGPGGAYGTGVSNGLVDHLMWINNQGGIEYKDPQTGKTERVEIKMVWEDNATNPAKSVSIYKRLKAAGAKVIYIHNSGPGEALSPSLSRDRILGVCYGYASPAGYRPEPLYYMSKYPTIVEDFATMAKWFTSKWKESRPPRIAGMVMDTPSWRVIGEPEGAKAEVEKLGAEWAGIEFMPMMPTDLSVQISRIIEKRADVIGFYGISNHTRVMAKDMLKLGVDPKKIQVIVNGSGWDESLLTSVPEEVGFIGEIPTALPWEDVPGVRLAKKVALWRGRKIEVVRSDYLHGFVLGYIFKAGLKTALEKVGIDKVAPTDIRNVFFNLKDVDVGGVSPNVTVREPDYPVLAPDTRYSKIEGGRFKIIPPIWIEYAKVKFGRR